VPLQKLTALHVKECYARMGTEPRADGRAGTLSNRSIRYAHTVLKMALKEAVRTHLLVHNVADEVDPPKAVRPTIAYWNGREAQRFLAVADTDPYRALWHLALPTGMRKSELLESELLGLRLEDVDLEHGVVHMRQQRTKVQGPPGERTTQQPSAPKSHAGHRAITLSLDCMAILKAYIAARPVQPIPLHVASRGQELVFIDTTGQPLVHDTITDRFDRLVEAAGVTQISFHGMRHTHATLLLLAGVNVKAVSTRLGHSSIQITLDTYAHVLPEMEQHAAQAIGDALAPAL
jgi:integrase